MRGATPDANVERRLEEACLLTLDFVIGGMMERGNGGRADPTSDLGVLPGSRS